MDSIYGDFQTTGLTILPATINKENSMYSALVCSISEAMTYIRTNPESAVTLMSKRFPEVPMRVAADALKRMSNSGVIPSTTLITKAAWYNAIKLRKESGDLKPGGEYNQFVDNQFAEKCTN